MPKKKSEQPTENVVQETVVPGDPPTPPEVETAPADNPNPLPTTDPISGLAPREAVHLYSFDRTYRETVPYEKNTQRHQIDVNGKAYIHFSTDTSGRWCYEECK